MLLSFSGASRLKNPVSYFASWSVTCVPYCTKHQVAKRQVLLATCSWSSENWYFSLLFTVNLRSPKKSCLPQKELMLPITREGTPDQTPHGPSWQSILS